MTWVDHYIKLVTATHKQHILLHDRDQLLAFLPLATRFDRLGYTLISAGSPWAVRVQYELNLRDQESQIILLIPADYQVLPDMIIDTYVVDVGLHDLFPLLDASVLQGLPAVALEAIYATRHYEHLGHDATLKWLLEHLYNVDADSLKPNPGRERVKTALDKVIHHPAGTNAVILNYLTMLATPYQLEYEEQVNSIQAYIDAPSQTVDAWLKLLPVVSKAMYQAMTWPNNEVYASLKEKLTRLNDTFQSFLDAEYTKLNTLSAVKRPAVVSSVLNHLRVRKETKIALIVIDGMNGWQGHMLVDALQLAGLSSTFGATMAFIPSITAWSRQALFRGAPPDQTMNNSTEGKLFQQYWQGNGLTPQQIMFASFGHAKPFLADTISATVVRLGLVCNDLDEMMHGAVMGNQQLELDTKKWLTTGPILPLVTKLKDRGFTCFLTADHGSLEATGLKSLRLSEKVGSLSRSKRHVQFANSVLLDVFVEQNPQLAIGIRDHSGYLRDSAALTTSSPVITHGGSHFWEVVVPFIEV